MATKEKIVDLKSRPEKINEEELKGIQEVVNNINRAQIEIGSLEVKKHALVHHVSTIQEDLGQLQKELESKYGTVDINIQDGVIKYVEDVKANS
mgnify:CR=1 FL=1